MAGATTVTREQVLAFRIRAQGLDRSATRTSDLPVLDLGVQDGPGDAAALALAARLADPTVFGRVATVAPDSGSAGSDGPGGLTAIWSFRGAPHLHRSGELEALARALWPRDDEDAAHRVNGYSAELRAAGLAGLPAFRAAADAMAEVVREPLPKGEVSAAVTRLVPEGLTSWCRGCGATHVFDQVLRAAALPAGAAIVPGRTPLTLAPVPGRPGRPERMSGVEGLIERYLRLHGPAGPGEAGGFLGMARATAQAGWPGGLAEVHLEGRSRWIPAAALPDLTGAAAEPGVRLLPRSDPYLQARDRDLLVPERARQKEIWRILGNPGAVLSGTEIAGVWRMKTAGQRLTVTVQPFGKLTAAERREIDAEAQRIALVRHKSGATVEYPS